MSITPVEMVDVIYPGKKIFPVMLENENLVLDTVKQYFPLAVGLKYEVNQKVHYLSFFKKM